MLKWLSSTLAAAAVEPATVRTTVVAVAVTVVAEAPVVVVVASVVVRFNF